METFSDLIWTELFALGFGLFGWIASFRGLKKARVIEDTPTSKVRSAHQGYVELIGTTEANPDEEPLLAPLTKTPCVWYFYEIEKHESSGKRSHWRTLEKRASKVPFILDDGTGECAIHPDRADVTTNLKKVWYGNSRYPTSTTSSGLFSRRYRYTEKRIHAAQTVYALGHFETLHPPSMAEQTKQKMNTIINGWKQDYDELVEQYDVDGSGDIDLKEWEAVRAKAQKAAADQVRENYDHTPINVMSYSPNRRQPYLISTSDPKQLSQRYRWQFMGFGALGIACTLGFFYLLPQTISTWQAM